MADAGFRVEAERIAEDIIQETLGKVYRTRRLITRLHLLQSRKLKQKTGQNFAKMYDHLARRGFSYDTASAAIRRVWSERDSGL
jgi:SOS response regulatory protein OraA/RecX